MLHICCLVSNSKSVQWNHHSRAVFLTSLEFILMYIYILTTQIIPKLMIFIYSSVNCIKLVGTLSSPKHLGLLAWVPFYELFWCVYWECPQWRIDDCTVDRLCDQNGTFGDLRRILDDERSWSIYHKHILTEYHQSKWNLK